jgi:hypothetical protein
VLAIILMQPPLGVEPRPALETPDAAFAAALDDLLARVPPARRYHTRYLSLAAVPAADRPDFIKAITFTLNSLSFRTTLYKPLEIPGGLLRIDLTGLEWDREARARRLNLLEKQGVKFPDRKKLEDVWELIAAADPYYFANQDQGKGQLFRGWIDPLAEQKLREVSYSSKAVLRADWLLAKLWVEKKFGGFYSRVLLLPATENELYKVLAVDIARVDSEVKLKRGAAVVDSDAVARFNREVQLVPGAFGEVPFVWRTLDFSNEDSDDRDVTRTFAGKAKHDGREIIFSLPNGLHGYYLADGKGNQAAVVPQDIALDRRPRRSASATSSTATSASTATGATTGSGRSRTRSPNSPSARGSAWRSSPRARGTGRNSPATTSKNTTWPGSRGRCGRRRRVTPRR